MSELWTIELLGGLCARYREERITRFATQKTASLLAYLSFYRRQTHLRETLIEMLWPEVEPAQGRSRLSTLLSYLRSLLEPPGVAAGTILLADRNTVRLNPEILTTDTALFEQRCRAAAQAASDSERIDKLQFAIEIYGGDLLPGIYEDWVVPERAHCCERYVEALYARSRLLEKCRRTMEAVEAIDTALKVDTYREDFYRVKMRCLAGMSRPDAALNVYEDLVRILRDELSATPAPRTNALAEQIRLNPDKLAAEPAESDSIVVPRQTDSPANTDSPSLGLRLPIQLTRFLGRDEEVARLSGWLESGQRLITLTGTGGTGKTRMAIETARRVGHYFADSIWFVDLSRIQDSRLIPFAIAQSMQIPSVSNADPLDQVVSQLRLSRSLVVLDNFEHLLFGEGEDARPENPVGSLSVGIVRLLMERVPQLTCLITSRQPLHLGGEQEFPISVLSLPTSDLTPEHLMECGSVALYVDRAKAVRPDFALTRRNSEAVAALCRKLEGMPLAIEMAAAWAKTLTPTQMLERLESQIDILTSRRRDLPPRHQSMKAAIEWSYDLLDSDLRSIFARLSVFRGGWTAQEASRVCGHESDILPALSELQERSLIVGEENDGEIRFRFLETLREYAAAKLEETGDQQVYLHRHFDVFLALAEQARPYLSGPDQAVWLTRLEKEHDNFRAALPTCLQSDGTVRKGLALVGLLSRFWIMRGYIQEGRKWMNILLNHPAGQELSIERSAALHGAGNIAVMQSDFELGRRYFEEGLEIAKTQNDLYLVCLNRLGLGKVAQEQGRFDEARGQYTEVITVCRQGGFLPSEAVAENNLGTIAARLEDYAEARNRYERSLEIRRALGDTWGIANTLRNLGYSAKWLGDIASARRYHEESLKFQRQLNNPSGIGYSLHGLGNVALDQGDFDAATKYFIEGLELKFKLGEKQGIAFFLECFASLAQRRGSLRIALKLHASAEALLDQIGYRRADKETNSLKKLLERARKDLGEDLFQQETEAGRNLTLEEAVSLAREQSSDVSCRNDATENS